MPENQAQITVQPINRRIHEAYSGLPDSERRIAEAILSDPTELAVASATELAAQAQVSNATVTRFFRRIGYASFDEAKKEARRMRAHGSPLFTGSKPATKSEAISDVIRSETALLEATLSRVNPTVLAEIGRALASARRIRTLGYRNSHFLAQYVTAQLSQLRPDVVPLLMPGQMRGEAIASLQEGDVVILVGFRRRPANFEQTLEAIAARGVSILLLSDRTIRSAPQYATWLLDCVVETSDYADSYIGALSAMRLIFLEARHALGQEGQRHLEQVEELRETLNELE